jgi:hypothetical protein
MSDELKNELQMIGGIIGMIVGFGGAIFVMGLLFQPLLWKILH